MSDTYKIIRFHRERPPRAMKHGLTLKEAQEHCKDPTTHKIDKQGNVLWFDGYTKE